MSQATRSSTRVVLGLERLFGDRSDCIWQKRLGLIANPTSVDSSLHRGIDRLHRWPGARLRVLFGPEHGLEGFAQDQVTVGDASDAATGLPVRSLYGPTREPTPEMLSGIDALIFDIQDVGARYYTFIWTMAHAMEACARHGIEMIVCDRPNPIGGQLVEGPPLEKGLESFVGLYPIPNRHGMTVGELARLFNVEYGIGCTLSVVEMQGWSRTQWFDETGLTWVMSSPNMPSLDTATVYPGMCLLEGTNVSEGRGTTRPFEICGAPWVEPSRLVSELGREHLPGVRFRPLVFRPTFDKFAGELCGGLQQHVVDRASYRPVRTALAILEALHRLWPGHFRWRPPPYEYETERPAIDILAGTRRLRQHVEEETPLVAIEREWDSRLSKFLGTRQRYLMYV